MRIAIVDDLAAERTLLKDRLERQLQRRTVQADILEYESSKTFLEAAREAPFTAAFLDIYMDGMTGMEAAGPMSDVAKNGRRRLSSLLFS